MQSPVNFTIIPVYIKGCYILKDVTSTSYINGKTEEQTSTILGQSLKNGVTLKACMKGSCKSCLINMILLQKEILPTSCSTETHRYTIIAIAS